MAGKTRPTISLLATRAIEGGTPACRHTLHRRSLGLRALAGGEFRLAYPFRRRQLGPKRETCHSIQVEIQDVQGADRRHSLAVARPLLRSPGEDRAMETRGGDVREQGPESACASARTRTYSPVRPLPARPAARKNNRRQSDEAVPPSASPGLQTPLCWSTDLGLPAVAVTHEAAVL